MEEYCAQVLPLELLTEVIKEEEAAALVAAELEKTNSESEVDYN